MGTLSGVSSMGAHALPLPLIWFGICLQVSLLPYGCLEEARESHKNKYVFFTLSSLCSVFCLFLLSFLFSFSLFLCCYFCYSAVTPFIVLFSLLFRRYPLHFAVLFVLLL